MSETKKYLLIRMLTSVLVAIALGILLILIDGDFFTRILFIIFGVIFILEGLLALLSESVRKNVFLIVANALAILLGILLIFFQEGFIRISVGIYFIGVPVILLILRREYFKEELKEQLPKIVVGLLVLILGIGGFVNILLDVLGWILIVGAVLYLILGCISLSKHE